MWEVKEGGTGFTVRRVGHAAALFTKLEQNALMIAAAMNADSRGETLTVVPMTVPMREVPMAPISWPSILSDLIPDDCHFGPHN